jgi:hypothetical protein
MGSTERKMAAIVAMDVTSYSEKMGRDEEGSTISKKKNHPKKTDRL